MQARTGCDCPDAPAKKMGPGVTAQVKRANPHSTSEAGPLTTLEAGCGVGPG